MSQSTIVSFCDAVTLRTGTFIARPPGWPHYRANRAPSANVSQALARLLDHPIGAKKQRRRQGKAERVRGLEVDDQKKFSRKLNRQVGWLSALDDLVDESRGLPIDSSDI